ncbi:hypothetical protein CEXT_105461 [Caerostris extrusa]|uniref:Uncharacterized protein n=1 Tax=Caerostris extrusa TaxID=172846 RepID=A0AAV4W2W3_CAEEX|nr:hypothetical protein CEXT_105461 [Caerostris extrusa]
MRLEEKSSGRPWCWEGGNIYIHNMCSTPYNCTKEWGWKVKKLLWSSPPSIDFLKPLAVVLWGLNCVPLVRVFSISPSLYWFLLGVKLQRNNSNSVYWSA